MGIFHAAAVTPSIFPRVCLRAFARRLATPAVNHISTVMRRRYRARPKRAWRENTYKYVQRNDGREGPLIGQPAY